MNGFEPSDFVRDIREEVRRHHAVAHPFLKRFAEGGMTRWQLWAYASQHYRLVGAFPGYLERRRRGRSLSAAR